MEELLRRRCPFIHSKDVDGVQLDRVRMLRVHIRVGVGQGWELHPLADHELPQFGQTRCCELFANVQELRMRSNSLNNTCGNDVATCRITVMTTIIFAA